LILLIFQRTFFADMRTCSRTWFVDVFSPIVLSAQKNSGRILAIFLKIATQKQSCRLATSAGDQRRDIFVNFYAKSFRPGGRTQYYIVNRERLCFDNSTAWKPLELARYRLRAKRPLSEWLYRSTARRLAADPLDVFKYLSWANCFLYLSVISVFGCR
jgi:hypothetical protein